MRQLRKTVFLCCLAGLLVGCRRDVEKPQTGSLASDFRLDALDHDRFYLNQQRGKVVVLAFWATWCRFCKGEMVGLKSLSDVQGAEHIVVAAVCTDPENMSEVEKVVETLEIDYPVLLDRGRRVSRKYGISVLPTTVVIDRQGYISLISEGYSPMIMRRIKARIESILASDGNEQ